MTNQPKDVEDASKKIAIEVTATLDVVLFKGKYTPSVLVTIGKILQEKIEPILTTHTEKRVREAVEAERKKLKEKLQDYWVEEALNQPKDVEKLWNKYRHEGDETTPDRMFYENFVDAITEAIAEAEEDIDLLTEEMARLREDVENARAVERERIKEVLKGQETTVYSRTFFDKEMKVYYKETVDKALQDNK